MPASAVREAVERASGDAAARAFSELVPNWRRGRWRREPSKVSPDTVADILRSNADSCREDLAEYLAATALPHCFDGWAYLGRALHAEMAGDSGAAYHLGYYAFLRAARSRLARAGICVLNNRHFALDEAGAVVCVRGQGTHDFVSEALDAWAGTEAGNATVLRIVQPGRRRLGDWLQLFDAQSLPHVWMWQWGLDRRSLTEDRNARNVASYRPTAFVSAGPPRIAETVQFVSELWELCDPQGSGGFPRMDRHLLRRSLRQLQNVAGSDAAGGEKDAWRDPVQALIGRMPISRASARSWLEFLTGASSPRDPLPFDEARKVPGDGAFVAPVLSRAVLLLRLATGAAEELMGKLGAGDRAALDFWVRGPRVRRLLWTGQPPESFVDLWADVREAVESVRSWRSDSSGEGLHGLWSRHARDISTLAFAERIFLWGARL